MASKAVRVYIDRQELIGYTSLSLSRTKEDLTGQLSITVFMGWLPTEASLVGVTKGREVLVYIGGYLAFTGFIDRRNDRGEKSSEGGSVSLSVGADSYTVTFTARGKTKYLIDSSHQHPTGTMLRPTNRAVFEELLSPWGISLDWRADTIALDRVRFRDGGRVVDEIHRIAHQCSLYVHETRDGLLRVTDKANTETGEAIILGQNILSFSTDQAETDDRSQVTVKGQRTEITQWGTDAVIPTLATVTNSILSNFTPVTVQLYGNATQELIDRRAQYEVNQRSAASRQVEVEVFHVQQTHGEPWDIGVTHYVEIPPAGIRDNMEVISVAYTVERETLKTSLTLAPPPAVSSVGAASGLAAVEAGDGAAATDWSRGIIGAYAGGNAGATASSPALLSGVGNLATSPPLTLTGG